MNTENMELERSAKRITKFLWWCAGADEYFLLRSPMHERAKYAGIGGTILTTGLLSGCAGYLAFDTIYAPSISEYIKNQSFIDKNFWIISLIFSIFWGLLFFNLDRFIITSSSKGDGTGHITVKELKQAIPRITFALILGLTISKPIEIKILKPAVDLELQRRQEAQLIVLDSLTDVKFKSQIAVIDKDLEKIESERNVLVERQKAAEKEFIDQVQGKRGCYGPKAKQLLLITKESENKIIEFDKKNNYQISSLKTNREKKLKEGDFEKNIVNKEKIKKLDNLLTRIGINNEIESWLGFAITMILLCINILPIFYKMMMSKGVYELMLEKHIENLKIENKQYSKLK